MKRLAWLLLALSLPAWATINGVDSSRIIIPSWDGNRYSAYPAGDAPQPPPVLLYSQGFETLNTAQSFSKGADLYGSSTVTLEDFAGMYWAGNCNSGISVSTDRAREATGTKSLKYVNNFAVYGDFGCPGTVKARVEYQMASNVPKLTKCDVKGVCGEWGFNEERWIGFSVYFPTSGNAKWTQGVVRPIFFQLFGTGATTGDPNSPVFFFHLGANGELDVNLSFSVEAGDLTSSQDYVFTNDWIRKPDWTRMTAGEWAALKTNGSSNAEYHLADIASVNQPYLQRDQWHDFVIHHKKGYVKAEGLVEIWMDGVKVVDIPAFPTVPNDFYQSFLKSGLYGGQNSNGGTYTMYLDSYRAADETGSYATVDPSQDDAP